MKKLFSALLAVLFALSMVSGAAAAAPQIETEYLRLPLVHANELYIFHTNDTHGRLSGSLEESDEGAFSAAQLCGIVKGMKELGHNVLLLDAGDAVHGKISANLYEGYSVVNVMNKMGYDAMATGNHEFDYGFDRLLVLEGYADFPLLNANLTTDAGEPVFEDVLIKEFEGFKVGIFGLSTPETATKANPTFFEGYAFGDVIQAAQRCVDALKAAGCDYIIALGHIGMDEASPVTSYDVTEAVEGIDLFIDGHSHTVLESGVRSNGTLIVSTGEYLQNVGLVKVSFGANGFSTEEACLFNEEENPFGNGRTDRRTQRLLDAYLDAVEGKTADVVGVTAEKLDGEREQVRTSQTNLGSLVADAMRYKAGADMAITNGGGIRASIEAGDITYEDILTVLPFGNFVVVKKLTGAQVLQVLEESVAAYPEPAGGFMQVSGLAFWFDPSMPAGSRVVEVTVNGEPLDEERVYTVATNDFLADGGDGSSLGLGAVYGEYGPLDQVLLEYMDAFGCVYEPGERVTPVN